MDKEAKLETEKGVREKTSPGTFGFHAPAGRDSLFGQTCAIFVGVGSVRMMSSYLFISWNHFCSNQVFFHCSVTYCHEQGAR